MSVNFFVSVFVLLGCLNTSVFAQIVTTIKPLSLITQAVTQGIEQPQQLLPIGASAHHYSLKPSQRLLLQKASLMIWIGNSHENFLQQTLKNVPHLLTIEKIPHLHTLPWRNLDTHHAQANTVDGHLWLNPHNAIAIAYAIAQQRSQQNPTYAPNYQKNAQAFEQQILAKLHTMQQKFKGLQQRNYIAYHDAYQYIEAPLGLNYWGSISISPEQKPSVKHLLTLKQQVTQQGWQCLLAEPQFDKGLADKVFGKNGRYVMIDENFNAASSYEQGWVQMAEAIYNCLK